MVSACQPRARQREGHCLGPCSPVDAIVTNSCIVYPAAEIPAFHYQGLLLKYIDLSSMLHVVQLAYVLRLALYAMLPWAGSPAWVLPVELLHGICFGLGWGCGTVQCKRIAPSGLEATMQVSGTLRPSGFMPGHCIIVSHGLVIRCLRAVDLCDSGWVSSTTGPRVQPQGAGGQPLSCACFLPVLMACGGRWFARIPHPPRRAFFRASILV
jgi:hypothetical protein